MPDHCHCQLPAPYCVCQTATQFRPPLKIALLLHENEPQRPTNTSGLIRQLLPESECYIWQRKEPPEALIQLINDPSYQPWLLFPGDRPELAARVKPLTISPTRTPLFIVPDGTWKEVRKMVRKSPWLDQIPLLSFTPERKTRYDLRRNPDFDHLCTAETVAELLRLGQQPDVADALDNLLDRFLLHYKAWNQHLPLPQD